MAGWERRKVTDIAFDLAAKTFLPGLEIPSADRTIPIVLIWMLLFFFGLGLPVIGIIAIVLGIQRKRRGLVAAGILVPILYWIAFWMLWEADQRFIKEETTKNGGETPDWVW